MYVCYFFLCCVYKSQLGMSLDSDLQLSIHLVHAHSVQNVVWSVYMTYVCVFMYGAIYSVQLLP